MLERNYSSESEPRILFLRFERTPRRQLFSSLRSYPVSIRVERRRSGMPIFRGTESFSASRAVIICLSDSNVPRHFFLILFSTPIVLGCRLHVRVAHRPLHLHEVVTVLGARGETQEGYADLSEDGVLQRIALRLTRTFPVEQISVNFNDGQRFLRDLVEEEEVEARAVLQEPALIFPL